MKKSMEQDFEERVNTLSPDLQLLLWSIRVDDQFTDLAEDLLCSKDVFGSFDSFKRFAFSKGVLSIFYKRLKTMDQAKLDPQLMSVFREAYMEILARNIKLINKLGLIDGLLRSKGIEYVTFKGPALGVMAYGDIAFRSSADLDILVSNNHFPKVVDLIREEGFTTRFHFNNKTVKYLQKTRRSIHLEKGFYHIDVHQQYVQGPSFLRNESWKPQLGSKIKLENLEVDTLSSEETLVVMAMNFAKEGFSSLKHLRDISGIILNHWELNWDLVLASAEKKKCLRILYISLGLSRKFCGVKLNPEIENEIAEKVVEKKIKSYTDRILSFNFDNESITAYFSFGGALDTLFSRFRFYLWHLVSPSPQIHKTIFNLPARLFFLIPILSPFYLLFSHFFKLIRSRVK